MVVSKREKEKERLVTSIAGANSEYVLSLYYTY